MTNSLNELRKKLDYAFKDESLLVTALTHRSKGSINNERLEFLGDAILGFVVAEILYSRFEKASEGKLSRFRSSLVKKDTLAELARNISLGDYLILGSGELKSGGFRRDSILADAMEAVIAAIYLDQGLEGARRFILDRWANRVDARVAAPGRRDYKTRLQEVLAQAAQRPRYRITEQGPDHDKTFTASVEVDGRIVGEGTGRSKKEAEQKAAARALERGAI